MPRRTLLLLLISVSFLLVQCRANHQNASTPSAAPTTAQPVATVATAPTPLLMPGNNHTYSFPTADGRDRSFVVHTPTGYDPQKRYPVVLVLHGGGGNTTNIAAVSGMSQIADTNGFIVVYPEGVARSRSLDLPTWNAGACCGYAAQTQVDDVAYIRQVVSNVEAAYSVDSSSVFVSGMSNGGMMTQRLACEATDVFAGAALVAGSAQIPTCTPSRPIPVLIIHGTADESVPYNGGGGRTLATRNTSFPPIEDIFHEWAARDSCTGDPAAETIAPLVDDGITIDMLSYASCAAPVVLYRVNGGTHSWPGGKPGERQEAAQPTMALNASETIWAFFAQVRNARSGS